MIPKKLSEREDMEGNMTVKGLIFDLDGVIVFTDKFHYQACACQDSSGVMAK